MRDEAQLQEDGPNETTPRTVAWFTFLGLAVAAGIFSLGFVIGGRLARLDIAHEPMIDPIARLDVQRKLHDDLTFYDDLTAKQKTRPSIVSTAPVANAPAAPAPVPAVQPPPPSAAAKQAAPTKVPLTTAVRSTAAAAEPNKPAASRPTTLTGLHDGPARAGEFTVQVSSYQSREEARAFCGSLERKGFRPFVVKTDLGPRGTWYRVRVGRFVDETKAKQAKQTLAQSDIPSWVLRTE